jgi:hypothetical protein
MLTFGMYWYLPEERLIQSAESPEHTGNNFSIEERVRDRLLLCLLVFSLSAHFFTGSFE